MAEVVRKRSEVPREERWNLEAMYRSDGAWEEGFAATGSFAEEAGKWAGRLGESPRTLRDAIEALLAQDRLLDNLRSYASLRSDEDLSAGVYSEMLSRIVTRTTEVQTAHSFFRPELLEIPRESMDEWLTGEELAPYRVWLEEILRYRPHTLSRGEEKILAMMAEPFGCFENAFGKLTDVEVAARLPEIVDEDGSEKKLTNGNLVPTLESPDPRVRRDAFQGYYGELQGNRNTLAALLDGHFRARVARARARGYDSALEASLFHDRVGPGVYDGLIGTIHGNLDVMERFYRLKKRVLGLDEMHIYDIYTPMVHELRKKYAYDRAIELTLEAVAPLGKDYVETLRKGLDSGWVDRYENVGKRSGAYSGGSYDSYPYMLMNFQGTLDWVFTLAHEAGHSMHSLYSNSNQPYHMAGYRILVAEVASTTNEMLLRHLLLNRTDDSMEKAYLLDGLVNDFRSTVFRQTMFAEFEKIISERVEGGEALTPQYLDEVYYGLVKLYHGSAFDFGEIDSGIAWEWGRIPHFYYDFYVYKYATGLCSAADISSRILTGEDGAVGRYLEFLRTGGSVPPLRALEKTGIDLTRPETVGRALALLEDSVEELERILG